MAALSDFYEEPFVYDGHPYQFDPRYTVAVRRALQTDVFVYYFYSMTYKSMWAGRLGVGQRHTYNF